MLRLGVTWREWVRMWCWNRCITETGWTSAVFQISWPACLCPLIIWLVFKKVHVSQIKRYFYITWTLAAGGYACSHLDGSFFFLTHPSTSHNVVFVSFWQFIQTSALWEWQAISQTTERAAAKGNKLGRPWDSAWAGSHQAGIVFHMFWLKLVKL